MDSVMPGLRSARTCRRTAAQDRSCASCVQSPSLCMHRLSREPCVAGVDRDRCPRVQAVHVVVQAPWLTDQVDRAVSRSRHARRCRLVTRVACHGGLRAPVSGALGARGRDVSTALSLIARTIRSVPVGHVDHVDSLLCLLMALSAICFLRLMPRDSFASVTSDCPYVVPGQAHVPR